MANPTVKLSADEKEVLAALDNIERAEDGLAKKFDQVGDAGEQAAGDIEKAFKRSNGKTLDEFELLLRELRKTGPEGGRQARAIEKHLQTTGERGRKSVGTILDRIGELDDKAAEAARAAEAEFAEMSRVVDAKLIKLAGPFEMLKKKASDMFGPGGVKAITGYSAALGGVTAILAVASKGFEVLKEKQDAAIGSLQAQDPAEKRLAQIATSSKDLDQMIQQADEISRATGMDRERSRNLIFSARSEGFAGDVGQIARFGQVVDTESQGKLAGSLGRLFKGEGLSVEQRLSGVLAAAEQSAFDFETVGESVKKSSAAAMAAGSDLAETLAANATLANLIGETAGDRVKAFASKVAIDDQLKGQGIAGAVKSLQAMPEDQRRAFLKDSIEINEAFNLLSANLPEVAKITEAVRGDIANSANGQGLLAQRTAIVEGSDRFQQRQQVARSEIEKQIAEERRFADSGAGVRAAENLLSANMDNTGVNTMTQGVLGTKLNEVPVIGAVSSFFGLPNVSAADVGIYGGQAMGLSPEVTSGALAGVAAETSGAGVPWYLKPLVQGTGVSRTLSNMESARQYEAADLLKEQTELLRRQAQAAEATAANTAPNSRPVAPPVNYGSGLQTAADSAARP